MDGLAIAESTPAHRPTTKKLESHGGGVDGDPSVTQLGDGW